uniref:Putative lysosomal & prostatic acid phosphatase n=1 Tax=Corethrella appendiculata TaxID=1370023 RepID=U5ES63_9DIPT
MAACVNNKIYLAIFWFCLLKSCVYSASIDYSKNKGDFGNSQDATLRMVHVFLRHGERTPADTYPTDPYLNFTFPPFGLGALTSNGIQSMIDNGKWLRKRYQNLLPKFNQQDIYAQCTDVSRTKKSTSLNLEGMFPLSETNNQQIPYTFQPLAEDTLLLVRTGCARYDEALQEVNNLPAIKKMMDDNKPLLKDLSFITNMSIVTPDDVQSLFSTLRSEVLYEPKLVLPKWTQDYYPDKLLPLTLESFRLNIYTDEMQRIKGGQFLKLLVNNWTSFIKNGYSDNARKFNLFLGHDSTSVNILAALGIWRNEFPDFGIGGIVELYEGKNLKYFVKVYYKELGKEPELRKIPGCNEECTLEEFVNVRSKTISTDLNKECIPKNPDATTAKPLGP